MNVLTNRPFYDGPHLRPESTSFDDIHVRRPLAHAVDRDTITFPRSSKGQASVATGRAPDQLGSEIGEQAAADAQAEPARDSLTTRDAARRTHQSRSPAVFSAELCVLHPGLGSTAGDCRQPQADRR